MSIKSKTAVWAGKLTTKILKLTGKGATAFPGKVARRICPDILKYLAGDMKIICVTGTNGKTTTCHVIRDMIEAKGNTVFCNDAGANLLNGVVSAFVNASSWGGKIDKDYAVIECDEAALKSIVQHFGDKDVTAVVTNLFRDQLDRYGDVRNTLSKIRAGLEQLPNVKLVLNADCSLTSSLRDVPHSAIYYFGMNAPIYEDTEFNVADAPNCIHCEDEYQYDYHTFGHLGGFYCEKCGYKREPAQVGLTKVLEWKSASSVVEMDIFGETVEAEVCLPGAYNLYNALAAITVAKLIELPQEKIISVLGKVTTHFGRMEQIQLGDANLTLALVKNPTGYNEVIQYLIRQDLSGNLVFGMNDNYADGTDLSWVCEVDFEKFAAHAGEVKHCYFTGKCVDEMQSRLESAGFDKEKFVVEKDYKTLIHQLQQDGEPTYLILSYTCMLELRDKLAEFVPLKKYES